MLRLPCVAFLFAIAAPALAAPPEVLTEWQWTELEGPLEKYIESVIFSPDGSLVAAGSEDTIRVWSVATGKHVTRMKLPQPQTYHRLAFSADGKTLISDCRDDKMIRFWDTATGKQVNEIERPRSRQPLPDNYQSFTFKAFAPTGDLMIADIREHTDYFELKLLKLPAVKSKAAIRLDLWSHHSWAEVAFAPDGKTFAYNGPAAQLRIFSTETGDLVRELRTSDPAETRRSTYRSSVRFSPDGKYLMAQEHTGRIETFDVYRFVIWGVADGRRYWSAENQGGWISAGNRYLLRDDKFVLDLLTDRTVPIRNGTPEGRRLAGMSPDGKTLAFVGKPSAAGVGPTTRLSVYLTPAPVLPSPEVFDNKIIPAADLDFLWSGVVADNLFRREFATKVLTEHPTQAMDIAKEKLKPVPMVERNRISELLKKLDDENADVRDKATSELQKLAHRFEPMLMDALKSSKPGEVRNRLTSITKQMQESKVPVELTAELRGISFLESLRTPEARKLLDALTAGAPGAKMTVTAGAAMKKIDGKR